MSQNQETPLSEAYILYVTGLKDKQKTGISQNLNRFVHWCGGEGLISSLTPQTVASYCEWVSRSGGDVAKKLEPVKAFLTFMKRKEMVRISLAPHARAPKSRSRAKDAASRTAFEHAELTQEGLEKLTGRLEELKLERTKVVGDIGRAMADKDFRENAPLDAAKERQGMVESEIRELEHILNSAVVAGATTGLGSQRVSIGKTVHLKGNGRKISYLVVHPREANPGEGKLSSESPVGKALLNKRAGQEVKVSVPRGSISYVIEKVA